MKKSACTVLLVLWCAAAGAEERVISEIQVRDNRRVEAEAILAQVKSKAGQPLDQEQVARDLRAIWSLGVFDDVRAEIAEQKGKTALVFSVREKPTLGAIEYQGQKEVELDKIKEVVDLQPLSVLDLNRIKKNVQKIKDLYLEKGFFLAEVSFRLEEMPRNQVKLVFVIDERAKVKITRINFIGNRRLSDDELLDIMETREGGFFSWLTGSGTFKQEGLRRDMMRLNQYYYDHGFINVKISEPLVEIARDRRTMNISFVIEEGEQFRFGNFSFAGELLVDDADLKSALEEAISSGGGSLSVDNELEQELAQKFTAQEVTQLKLEVLKELLAEVEARLEKGVWEEDSPTPPAANPLREKLRNQLLDRLKAAILHDKLLIKTGETFNRTKLGMSLFRLQDIYKDRGYAYVEVVPATDIDSVARVADIKFHIQRGPKVYIERIDITGNLKTRDKVIRRQMRVYEGELYSGTGLENSRRRVNSLGFFETVEITEAQGSRPDRIVLTVKVKERPTGTFQIGAGFSSVENFIATAQIAQQNLFGRGQTLALMAQLSSLRQLFSLQFVEPYFWDTSWYLAFTLYNTQLDYYTFLREASGGSLTLGYEFIDDWRVAFTYTLENVNLSARGGLRHYNLFRDGWTSSVQASLTWDTRDNQLFPSDGHLLQAIVEHASAYTLSENDFTRLSWVGRLYRPLFWGFVFKSNLLLGYLTPGAPIFEKYFAGGIYTVRGYEPRSIGPTELLASSSSDPSSTLTPTNVGGNKQFIGNLEIEFPIFPQVQIRGVVFLDAGNAFGEAEHIFQERYSKHPETGQRLKETWLGLYWSWGFGFRWFSPIGPLRFEWGIPLTPRPYDKDILFEFTIGNFF